MSHFGWLHLLFSTLWLFNCIQNVSSITSEGFRVEHGSSALLGNYVFAQNIKNSKIIRDCHDLRKVEGYTTDGAYIINPTGLHPFMVYCKFEPRNAWTRIQHRVDASVSFQRNWYDYKWGFGHPIYNYWIGLEHLYQMTHKQPYQMRVTLEYWNDTRVYASYSTFSVGTEQQMYRLKYDFLKGSAGDSLSDHHYLANFSTYDKDNDNRRYENCAITHAGGWWYNSCDRANLNGHYYYMGELKNIKFDNGIEWTTAAYHYSFQYASMMIAPNLELIKSQAQILQNQEQGQRQRTLTRTGRTDSRSLSGTGTVTQTGTGTRSGTQTGTGTGGGTKTGTGTGSGTPTGTGTGGGTQTDTGTRGETETDTEGGTPTGTGIGGGTQTGTGTGGETQTGTGTGGETQTGTGTGSGTQTGTGTGTGTQTGSQSQDDTGATEGQATGSQQQEYIINEGGASNSRTEQGTEIGGVGTGNSGTGNGGAGKEGSLLEIGIGRTNSGTHENRETGRRGSLLEINIGRRGSGTNNNNRGSRGGLLGIG